MTDQYVNIQGWMRDDLGLTGNRLFAYAIVWGFSQDGESLYRGGYRYLSSWVGCGINTIRSLMSSLVDDGLIIKEEELLEGKTRVNFRVNVERAKEQRGLQKLEGRPPKIGGDASKNWRGPIYKEGNKNMEYKEGVSRALGEPEFVPPTLQEVKDYVKSHDYHFDPIAFMAYYSNNGWTVRKGQRMKDWRIACVTFERMELKRGGSR